MLLIVRLVIFGFESQTSNMLTVKRLRTRSESLYIFTDSVYMIHLFLPES
jgi:hypothetical protein